MDWSVDWNICSKISLERIGRIAEKAVKEEKIREPQKRDRRSGSRFEGLW